MTKSDKKKTHSAHANPNLRVMQGHLFALLRPMMAMPMHTDIRDALARTRVGDFAGFEKVLGMVEEVTKTALRREAEEEEEVAQRRNQKQDTGAGDEEKHETDQSVEMTFSQRTAAKYKRPWWVAQPYIRPLPEEAIAKGALIVNKKGKVKDEDVIDAQVPQPSDETSPSQPTTLIPDETKDVPRPAMVCG